MPTIIFKNKNQGVSLPQFDPVPASKVVPEWFKKMAPEIASDKEEPGLTIKKCVPVLDSILAGYIIFTPFDLRAVQKEGKDSLIFQTPEGEGFIAYHVVKQFKGAPFSGLVPKNGAYKFTNHYGVYTEKGYSCVFQTPSYSDTPIKILPGVVDTDNYHEVNFPFSFEMPEGKTELFIPAGTPIAQVIPFRREGYSMSVEKYTEQDRHERGRIALFINGFYKRFCHNKKVYR